MRQALADYRIVGVNTNIDFLSRLVACPAFANADLDTGLIERSRDFLFPARSEPPSSVFFVAAVAGSAARTCSSPGSRQSTPATPGRHGACTTAGG
jgi:3-methylcrotonyl-CoA carboxylase alpha subunit